jgi:hypothetical protein
MAEQAGHGNGQGRVPRRDPGLPDGAACVPGRDAHLAGFAKGGEWDACPPSASLAVALEAASGPGWRCAGASREEMFGLLRQWQALESRAAAAKLGILRALIRDDDQPLPGGGHHGDLPAGWTRSLTHDVALALSMPAAPRGRRAKQVPGGDVPRAIRGGGPGRARDAHRPDARCQRQRPRPRAGI